MNLHKILVKVLDLKIFNTYKIRLENKNKD